MDECNCINAAVEHYLNSYKAKFSGTPFELQRLYNLTVEKLRALETKQAIYYRNKLHPLVYQTATRLSLSPSKKDFDSIHRVFLHILDSLVNTQPIGDVDFELERSHFEAKDQLRKLRRLSKLRILRKRRKTQQELRAKKHELEAKLQELEAADVDMDSEESTYLIMERIQEELDRVELMIGNHQCEEQLVPLFVFMPKPGGGLDFLRRTDKELYEKVEQGVQEILKKEKRENISKETVSEVFHNILGSKVEPDDAEQILHGVYEALNDHFKGTRKMLMEKREHYYTTAKHLLPKEGDILADPDKFDPPAEVLYQLKKNAAIMKKKAERRLEESTLRMSEEENGEHSGTLFSSKAGTSRVCSNKELEENSDSCESSDDDDMGENGENEKFREEEYHNDDIEVIYMGPMNQQIANVAAVNEEPPDMGYESSNRDLDGQIANVEPTQANMIESRPPTAVGSLRGTETVHHPVPISVEPPISVPPTQSEPIPGGSDTSLSSTLYEMLLLLAEQEKGPQERSMDEDCEVIEVIDVTKPVGNK